MFLKTQSVTDYGNKSWPLHLYIFFFLFKVNHVPGKVPSARNSTAIQSREDSSIIESILWERKEDVLHLPVYGTQDCAIQTTHHSWKTGMFPVDAVNICSPGPNHWIPETSGVSIKPRSFRNKMDFQYYKLSANIRVCRQHLSVIFKPLKTKRLLEYLMLNVLHSKAVINRHFLYNSFRKLPPLLKCTFHIQH